MLPDVEGVLDIMDCNIVLVGFKAGHPPALLTHSEVCMRAFRVSIIS